MQRRTVGLHILKTKAFTLIELLVVIAIIAILAVVVVLTLNPVQLLAQSRDANRVSDMATLNSAINLYNADQAGASTYSLGAATTSYISVPSTSSNCSTLGIASSAYNYSCSTSANYRNASATGWVPIAFNSISSGAPFGSLPVDPVDQTSSNLYYSYETNGSQYVLSAFMESSKYAKNMETTGGVDPALYEIGSGVNALPDASRGLAGYWPLNEGTGMSAIDWSGYGNTGTWHGTATGTNGYYSPGHVWQWSGAFATTTGTYVDLTANYPNYIEAATSTPAANLPSYTLSIWADLGTNSGSPILLGKYGYNAGILATGCNIWNAGLGSQDQVNFSPPANTWFMATMTYSQATQIMSCYLNGSLLGSVGLAGDTIAGNTYDLTLGAASNWMPVGLLSDARIYNRTLSAQEVQEIYNAEK